MTQRAAGSFDVKVAPQSTHPDAAVAGLARMSIDKRFHGPLDAISRGEMLAAHTAVEGSAAYVAIERVEGTLDGRRGTFVLQHSATMTRGEPRLSITVVPDSGTDELTGLTGRMGITITAGAHDYDFEYTLGERA